MATTSDRVFERLEDAALGALDDYMEYRTYAGQNPDYYKRARLGIPVLSTYGRVRGTRANERQLALLERRIASGEVVPETPAALAAPQDQQDTGNSGVDAPAADQASAVGARKGGRKS